MHVQEPLSTSTYREIFNKHFKELKHCPQADVSKHAMPMLEIFSLIPVAEREEYADAVYELALQHKAGKPLLFAYANLLRSFNHFYLEHFDKALPMLIETEKLFNEQGDLNGAAVSVGVTGSIYRTYGIVDLALKAMMAAHEQVKTSETYMLFTMASGVTIASIYVEQKHYDDAIVLFNDMLKMPEKHFKFYWDVYSLHGLGKIYMSQKKMDEALQCFNRAMAIAETNKHPISICNSLSELGNYYFITGDLEKAEQFFRRSLEMREQYNFVSGAITSCIRLGELFLKQSRLDEALQVLEKGLKKAEEIKIKPKMSQIHHCLAELYERKNNLAKSLYHYKMFHQLHNEVEEEENARKVKNVKAYLEAEQVKKENAVIKAQKAEIERKNIQLQETIDELTRARIGKKARAITLLIAIIMFIFEDTILHFALRVINTENYFISMAVKMTIIFSLAPINKAIEKYLLRKVIRKRKEAASLAAVPT